MTRLDNWVHRRRQLRALKRGKRATIIPAIGYGGDGWVRVLGRVLYLKDAAPSHLRLISADFVPARVRGWRSFTSVHAPHERIQVSVNGRVVDEVVADSGGVIDAKVNVTLTPGWHYITMTSSHGDTVQAPINVVDPTTPFGVISDIDDTVLNTVMPRPFVAAWNSFVADQSARLATPGMPVLLDHLSSHHPGSPVIYLSTGAWNVAPALSHFFSRHLYPIGPMLLTDWGPTHDRWFRSGRAHKKRELNRLVEEFPTIKWVLIGDDGQHDEAIYADVSTRFPDRIAAVAIRQLSVGEAMLVGGRSKAAKHHAVSGVPWIYGPDGASLREQFVEIGLLGAPLAPHTALHSPSTGRITLPEVPLTPREQDDATHP